MAVSAVRVASPVAILCDVTGNGEGPRILVAGMGNVLRRDDGFGVAVARRLLESELGAALAGVTVLEAGIAGVRVVQELMDGYDGLILVDAARGGGAPGTVYEISPHVGETAPESLHTVEPGQVLALARAAGCLPERVLLVGCEPAEYDALGMEENLTPAVAAAVPRAVALVTERVAAWRGAAWRGTIGVQG